MNLKLKQFEFRHILLYVTFLLIFSASLSFVILGTTIILRNIVDVVSNLQLGFLSFIVCFGVLSVICSISKKLIFGDYSFFVLPQVPSKGGFHFYVWVPFAIIFSMVFVYLGTILFDFDFEIFALNGANIVMFSGWTAQHVEAALRDSKSGKDGGSP